MSPTPIILNKYLLELKYLSHKELQVVSTKTWIFSAKATSALLLLNTAGNLAEAISTSLDGKRCGYNILWLYMIIYTMEV